jgi:riboflavin kinase/FMN adenylyltransferase
MTIGNFDGAHLGHQALLARVVQAARERGLPAAVMTFEPNPREFFAARAGKPEAAPARIANLRDKLESLAACGIDRVIVEHFNARFAALTAEDFIQHVLVEGCHVRWLAVGDDFRFGAGRTGSFDSLKTAGIASGFEVHAISTVNDPAGLRISSSAVRKALAAGEFDTASILLGRPYSIGGHVVHGRKLGRTLGFPTLNLRVTHKHPAVTGIFVVRVHGLAEQALQGVASLGVRPTVEDNGRVLLETHVLDWTGDAYGKLVRIEFIAKLRDEQRYDGLDALTAAIANDERNARAVFASLQASGNPP